MTTSGNKTTGAVIYTRVSTGEQAEHGTSLGGQRDACRTKALTLGLPIIAEYEDAGFSGGFLLSRPGMMAALADIQAGRADTLICANVSRYSRDVEHQQTLLKSVRAAGGRLVFCDVELANTPEGDLMFSFLGGYAQYERQTIRTRTMAGRRRRAEDGIQAHRTFAPYGYHIPTNKDVLSGIYPVELVGRYVILEEQAAVVRQLFQWYADGVYSLAAMARQLNESGVPTVRGGRIWRSSTLMQMLTNTVYKGEATHGKHLHHLDESRIGMPHLHTGRPLISPKRYKVSDDYVTIPCPALVSEGLWDKAQARFAINRTNGGGNPQRLKMLSGLVVCPGCGGNMTHKGERTRLGVTVPAHYRCVQNIDKQRLEGIAFCNARTYRLSVAEGAVTTAILDAIQRPQIIEEALEAYRQECPATEDPTDAARELAAVERGLKSLEEEQGAAVRAQIAGIMAGASPAAYDAAFADIAARRQELIARQEALQKAGTRRASRKPSPAPTATKEAALRDVYRVLTMPEADGAVKRKAVGAIVQRVVCQKGGADVHFHPGIFGEGQAAAETIFSVFTAWASYLGL